MWIFLSGILYPLEALPVYFQSSTARIGCYGISPLQVNVPHLILDFLFAMLNHEGVTVQCLRVDEDGALANSSEFCDFLLQQKKIT
jgi:hypothetical protein